jgi:hypothetical protein
MQTICGPSKMEFFPDKMRKLVRESLELVFTNEISIGKHFGGSETVVYTKLLDIYDIDFNNDFLFYFSALLDSEWLAIVKNDKCSYVTSLIIIMIHFIKDMKFHVILRKKRH